MCLRLCLSVCVFVYQMAPDRKEGRAGVVLFSEAEISDQLFPSEDNDESASLHPPSAVFTACFSSFVFLVLLSSISLFLYHEISACTQRKWVKSNFVMKPGY